MLEYVAFDFSFFGQSKLVANLGNFLNYLDQIDGFKVFDDRVHGKIFRDIAAGLAYLPDKDIAHRDLKPKNVLDINQHYCKIKKGQWEAFEKEPICCKLLVKATLVKFRLLL